MRRHLSETVKERVRKIAGERCGYCLSPQFLVMARLEIEHIIPLAKGGTDDESNLWLACPICNSHKRDQVKALDPQTGNEQPLFNPRTDTWHEHFRWDSTGTKILGTSAVGRATVVALKLDSDPDALLVRSFWVQAGWHPPEK
jgi:hypothetical protein